MSNIGAMPTSSLLLTRRNNFRALCLPTMVALTLASARLGHAFLHPIHNSQQVSLSRELRSLWHPEHSAISNLLTRSRSSRLHGVPDIWGSMFTAASSLEDMVYQIESAASSLAATSLQDPSNLGTALPILYLAGLLTSFSPCVWGLLPLTVSYISTAAGERKDQQTIWPTLAFAAGLAMVFCSLGVAAVEFGQVFGATTGVGGLVLPLLSNGICLLMGLKLLDLIDLPLPSLNFITPQISASRGEEESLLLIDATGQILPPMGAQKPSVVSNEGGALVRTFLLGGSSALVASPCATPVLTSILAFVARASNPVLGALLLLCYTLGYATPLLIVAGTGGQALVQLRQSSSNGSSSWYAHLAPWVTPITGGVLLYLGTIGMLTALFGDPSLAGLSILE
jgi:cytochrome c-type biogenesis protein